MKNTPDDQDIQRFHRWFAMTCNNRAWELLEQTIRTPEQDEEFLSSAHASVYHWRAVGDDRNIALGEVLLGLTHAALGDGDLADRYSARGYIFFTSRKSEPWELAFAEAACAHAAAISGRHEEHATHYARALEIADTLGEEDRKLFMSTFATLPAPVTA